MTDPRLALMIFAAITALVIVVAWPRRGLWASLRRMRRVSERVRIEDALKYLFHRSTAGGTVHADAVAGALQMRRPSARRLLDRLVAGGLATIEAEGYRLTVDGRREALRIVRSHRLLEQYFADRTGVEAAEWHELAEEAEHELSTQEIESLARRLGQPRFDPHGDPIPTATGELPAIEGVPLTHLEVGEGGTVSHLEDEPREDYERLATLGLALGKRMLVRWRGSEGLTLEVDGRGLLLPYELAEGVTVERSVTTRTEPLRTLAALGRGERATVRRISSQCRGAQRRRLLDLGVVPGTVITAEMRSATGDPMAYRIRGALIALRRQQADWIEVEPPTPERTAEDAA